MLGWVRRGWACLTLCSERCLVQQETGLRKSVTVEEVMEWLVKPPAIADMLGVRVKRLE